LIFSFIKKIRCDDSGICSNTLLAQLESHLGLTLHAETETDFVDGSLTIFHMPNHHTIRIEVNEISTGRLRVPDKIPTQNEVNTALETTITRSSIFTRLRAFLTP